MSLTLSDQTLHRIETAGTTLATPLDHAVQDDWFAAVTEQTAALLEADVATVQIISDSEPAYFSRGFPLTALTDYADRVRRLPEELQREYDFSYFRRMAAAGVWSRESLHGPKLPQYFRSAYFHEFVVPLKGYDAVGTTVAWACDKPEEGSASLLFHHSNPSGPSFGNRGTGILRLLLPFFRAGIEIYRSLGRKRQHLAEAIESLPSGVRVYDHRARTIAQNRALDELLSSESPSVKRCLTEAMDALTLRFTAVGRSNDVHERVARGPSICVGKKYRLQVTPLGETLLPTGRPGVLVTVDPAPRPSRSAAELRSRFGLTPREVEVAELLAQRLTNAEIARRLFISPYTVRRHTERILAKLRIDSRRDVAALLS